MKYIPWLKKMEKEFNHTKGDRLPFDTKTMAHNTTTLAVELNFNNLRVTERNDLRSTLVQAREYFRNLWDPLIVRRVEKVHAKSQDMVSLRYWEPAADSDGTALGLSRDDDDSCIDLKVGGCDGETCFTYTKKILSREHPHFTKEQVEHQIEHLYSDYTAETQTSPLDSDTANYYDYNEGRVFLAKPENYAELDFVHDMTFWFNEKSTPVDAKLVLPREGELICGYVDHLDNIKATSESIKTKKNQFKKRVPAKGPLTFTKWFRCSEQLYRLILLVRFDRPSYFYSNIKDYPEAQKDEALKRWLLGGSRLVTNSYGKMIRSLDSSNLMPCDELRSKMYHHYRGESTSQQYCHVYAALALILRYQELPGIFEDDDNTPKQLRGDYNLPFWDMPHNYVEDFVELLAFTDME
jgi:hypothetical protein